MTRSTILGGGTVVMVVSQDEAWEAGSSMLKAEDAQTPSSYNLLQV
jgi:hypothetical protein